MYKLGCIVETKKSHVCGTSTWKIIRTGADYKIECTNCKRVVLMSKVELDKRVKKSSKNKFI